MKCLKKVTVVALALIFAFQSMPVSAAGTQNITDSSGTNEAEVTVEVEINSQFTVGIPTTITLDASTGQGTIEISIKGDLDPRYKLVVTPVDGSSAREGLNFLLEDKSSESVAKDSILVDITPTKTEFLYNEINLTTPVTETTTLQATEDITAGKWQGIITYSITLEPVS